MQLRRVNQILAHVEPQSVATNNCSSTRDVVVDVPALKAFLDGKHADVLDKTREILKETPEFRKDVTSMHYHDFREQVLEWCKILLHHPKRPAHLTDLRDCPSRIAAFFAIVPLLSPSVSVKCAVQHSLWGGTVLNLGTERHAHMLEKIDKLELPGCFAMTEIGHGSNVRGIETTATYDKTRGGFIIHSPTPSSVKFWLGNAACHAQMSTVFAQLYVDGKHHGVHTFIVPIRDARGNTLTGITIRDCGHKMGLNGVDNGSIQYDHVFIPRENMLNRYSDVTPDGKYVCKLPSEARHFGATLGELSAGRVILSWGAVTMCKQALAIAIRYAFSRRQFGPGNKEVPIITYPTHQRRLMPLLARTMVFDIAVQHAADLMDQKDKVTALYHAASSGIKAYCSWHLLKLLDITRQCCGGQGFRTHNKVGALVGDTHVWATFEGDNVVLTQQTARYLLGELAAASKRGGKFSGVLAYMNTIRSKQLPSATKGDEVLKCLDALSTLFEAREATLLTQLGSRLKKHVTNGKSQWEAFTTELNLATSVTGAFVDRYTHELFVNKIRCSSTPSQLKPVLEKIAVLSALTQVHADLGTFVANNWISRAQANAVEDSIISLCAEVTKISPQILDSFALPEEMMPRRDLTDY